MRDYSKSRRPDPMGRDVRWYEWAIVYPAYWTILVIGPPLDWICDRVTIFLDRVWPDRPKPPPRRIP